MERNPGDDYCVIKESVLALLTEYTYYTYSCNSGDPVFYNSLQFSSLLEYP